MAAQAARDEARVMDLVRDRFARLAAQAGAAAPQTLGRQLMAMWGRALTDAVIEGYPAPSRAARAAAERLFAPHP